MTSGKFFYRNHWHHVQKSEHGIYIDCSPIESETDAEKIRLAKAEIERND